MKVFIPGPTEVSPEVLAAMSHPQIGHRTQELRDLVRSIMPGLKRLFGTKGYVFLCTSSATGALEASLRNTVKKKLLCIDNGAWSQKWGDMAELNGVPHERMVLPWGKAPDPDAIRKVLQKGGFDAVCMVWCETSTGALADLPAIAKVVREFPDVFLLVDAVSALAGIEIDVDALGIDVCIAGSQKCLAMPPGLALMSASDRAIARAATIPHRGLYIDFLSSKANADKDETPSTPTTAHFWALDVALKRIHAEGMAARARRHVEMADLTRSFAREYLGIFTDPGSLSPTVTCIENKRGVDLKQFHAKVKQRGFQLGDGYGKIKDTTFRVGHFGEHTVPVVKALIEAMIAAL